MRGVVREGVACPGLLCATSLRTGFRSACFCLSRCGKYSLHSVTIRGATFHRISTVFRSFAQYFELKIFIRGFSNSMPSSELSAHATIHYKFSYLLAVLRIRIRIQKLSGSGSVFRIRIRIHTCKY